MDENSSPLRWLGDRLEMLDQRLLPRRIDWISFTDAASVASAITTMVVRGAPAIGVAAAYGLALEARLAVMRGTPVRDALVPAAEILRRSRPTAVNLAWAVDRMMRAFDGLESLEPAAIAERLAAEACAIHAEDIEGNKRMGAFGAGLLPASSTVLTHCNAGALATGGYGTALGVIRAARDAGKTIAVFADETRPYLQGSRLTAWELQRDGIDVTVITDSMAGHFFSKGTFDAVIVGADRIAANGDAANKIGTYAVAVLANAHGVPFYVAAPLSTIDPDCATGAAIPIEERSANEVVETRGIGPDGKAASVVTAPDGVRVRHPAFDVTPARLITAIVTERGVLRPPYDAAIAALFQEKR
ncbi:MAG: S-methyl-5-thioribose-1-phosphate isomerase [Acidobacteria bacterium]|nr:S-methyl-5-thioribose-1-phosphate isomerase [Acidobacteriota bacterium]